MARVEAALWMGIAAMLLSGCAQLNGADQGTNGNGRAIGKTTGASDASQTQEQVEASGGEGSVYSELAQYEPLDTARGETAAGSEGSFADELPTEYVIYFGFGAAALPQAEEDKIAVAAEAARRMKDVHVRVSGHTDTVGSAHANRELSEQRARAVKRQLIAHGVTKDRITVRGYGESDLPEPTADGVREAHNRRVEIRLK